MLWLIAGLALALMAASLALRHAHARILPPPAPDPPPVPADDPGPLATAVARFGLPPGDSGILPLRDGMESFAERVALIRAARHRIDVQSYIWQPDAAGLILLQELAQAAARGLRIRLLLDDLGSPDLDPHLAALDALPGVEVRLFNPFILRRLRLVNLALDFGRLNRRMHNKSLTADAAASILGGRNIGDEYFEGGGQVHFIDFDLMVLGPAAVAVARDFDRYWHSPAAVPVGRLLRPRGDGLAPLAAAAERLRHSPEGAPYHEAMAAPSALGDLLAGQALPFTGRAQLVSDDPEKARGRARRTQLLSARLLAILNLPQRQADVISAYVVPGRWGLAALQALARRGVRLRVLTNGQQSTDVTLVHCGWARYRRKLLRAGIAVHELRPGQGVQQPARRKRHRVVAPASGVRLHAKTFALDDETLFVGSVNLDPRSMLLNTEMGLLLHCPPLAAGLHAGLDAELPQIAYELRLSRDGRGGALEWVEQDAAGQQIVHRTEPGTTRLSRLVLRLAGRLPIEWLL